MNILIVEPYYGGSHQDWCENLKQHSKYNIEIISLEARHWKWRMFGGAIALAHKLSQFKNINLIMVSDMIDLALFKSLNKKFSNIPHILYFHENQFAYPFSKTSKASEDLSYQFINYTSALCADKVVFNSNFNLQSFYIGAKKLLNSMPDHKNLYTLENIKDNSQIIPVGIQNEYITQNKHQRQNTIPKLLWNHRWDHDKNIKDFFQTLISLKERSIKFQIYLLGKRSPQHLKLYQQELEILNEEILINEHIENKNDYYQLLWESDIIPVTSHHDFFGISVIEAMLCNTHPLLPNRQVYPERIPSNFHSNYIYENSLTDPLINFISSNEWRSEIPNELTNSLFDYDWKNLIVKYDTFFESFSNPVNQ